MKRTLLAVAMLAAASSFAFSQTTRNNTSNDEQAIRQVLNDVAAALSRNDAAALDRFYDEGYTIVDIFGAVSTKAQRLAAIRSGDVRFQSLSLEEVGHIRRYGDTAVAISRAVLRSQERGQAVNDQIRVIYTLARTRGRWQVVAAHATRIAQQ